MLASHTSSWGGHRAGTTMRCCAAVLLLSFGSAMAGGGGHGGGHGGSHHGGHGAHHGHGHGFIGFGVWYPRPRDWIYCDRDAPDNDPNRCNGYYRYFDNRGIPSSDAPANGSTPPWIYGTGGVATGSGDRSSGQLTAAGDSDRLSVRQQLLSSLEAPDSLPDITRFGADRPVSAVASGSSLRRVAQSESP